MNWAEILTAWKNVVITKPEIEAIANTRRAICNSCPEKITLLNIECCGKCHCPILGKVHSPLNSCPLQKWET